MGSLSIVLSQGNGGRIGITVELGYLQLFFVLYSRQTASGSHIANTVLTTMAGLTIAIPQGNTGGKESLY